MGGKWEKHLIFSDLHADCVDMSVLEHGIKHHPNADLVHFNGDTYNGHEASPFPGAYPSMSAAEEHNFLVDFLDTWFQRFRAAAQPHGIKTKFNFNAGNHPQRVRRGGEKFAPNPYKLYGNWIDNLSVILAGFKMQKQKSPSGGHIWVPTPQYKWDNIYYKPGLNSWATEVGSNMIVCHAAKSFKLSSTMARLWYFDNILTRWPNARIVVQGHTHRQCDHHYGVHRYIESGCSCNPMEYGDTMGRSGWPPMAQGYVVAYRNVETNLVDKNSIEIVSLGSKTLFRPVPAPGSEPEGYEKRVPHLDPFPQIPEFPVDNNNG